MSTWIFLRHGESVANHARVFSGHHDVPLTGLGVSQARQAGIALISLLRGTKLDAALSSDLQRAKHTAELALEEAGLSIQLVCEPALRERHLGRWQGESIDKLKQSGERDILHTWTGQAPGGESLQQVATRAVNLLASLPNHSTTLLVGHGGLIRALLGLIDGTDTEDIGKLNIPNAQPIVREIPDGRWSEIADILTG